MEEGQKEREDGLVVTDSAALASVPLSPYFDPRSDSLSIRSKQKKAVVFSSSSGLRTQCPVGWKRRPKSKRIAGLRW